ncbi:ABC transporter permease [Microbacterium sp.]|uniref:ABC transporter permease n=1 Tax=Microbacterium sp. TaxID=51671 RepID=UPI003F7186CC
MSRLRALLGQRIRRDRLQVSLWVVGTALLASLSYVGVAQSYGSEQDRTSLLAAALANPVILLFRGLPSGTDEAAFMVFLIFPWLAILAAFMSTFLAVRHTRGDEEAGRAELVAATPAGRTLPIVATTIHGILANVLLALLTAAAFLAVGQEAGGSLLVGAATGAIGVTFLGVGLLAAQIMRTARGANALSVWVLLATFLAAGIGNAIGTPSDDLTSMQSSWLAWLSPFGWGENTRAFAENTWWPVALCLGAGAVVGGIAIGLAARRDLGESFVAERRGRAAAPSSLAGPTALVWRLTRGSVLGWVLGGLLTGLLSTSLASIVADVGAANPSVEEILDKIAGGGSIQQATVTTFFTMLGVIAACCAVQTVARARQEEARGTAEAVLATPVDRVRWLGDYVGIALVGIALVCAAGIAGAAGGIAGQDGDWSLMTDVWVVGAGQIAAASVFLVLTALVFVMAPRLTIALGWSLVLVGTMLGLFGPLFGFPDWLTHLSPVAVTPQVDGDAVDLRGLWWLVGVAVVGAAASLALMRRRELAADA